MTETDDEKQEKPEPNSLADFTDRFYALQEEAKGYGIVSVVALVDNDPFSGEDTMRFQHCGGFYAAIGMVNAAKARMESEA